MSERIQQFDFIVDLKTALLWQYNNAVNIQSLLTFKQEWYRVNQTLFWQSWFDDVFNLQTAKQFGLAVWAIILCLPLEISGKVAGHKIFGFGPKTNRNKNFSHGNFSNIDPAFNLTIEDQRLLLKLQYFKFTSTTAIPEINSFLKFAFDAYPDYTGSVYVLDPLNMTIRLICTQPIPERVLNIIKLYDLIPRGAGVGIKYINGLLKRFGFGPKTNGNKNFSNGNFVPTGTLS